jgi:hypothetical protein
MNRRVAADTLSRHLFTRRPGCLEAEGGEQKDRFSHSAAGIRVSGLGRDFRRAPPHGESRPRTPPAFPCVSLRGHASSGIPDRRAVRTFRPRPLLSSTAVPGGGDSVRPGRGPERAWAPRLGGCGMLEFRSQCCSPLDTPTRILVRAERAASGYTGLPFKFSWMLLPKRRRKSLPK